MKRVVLSIACALGVLDCHQAYAIPQVDLLLISRDECVFGDTDLIIRDLARDYSLGHRDSQLVLEVRNERTQEDVFRQTLVDLRNEERNSDLFARVFNGGLNFAISGLQESEYSVSICKIPANTPRACQNIRPKGFEEMAKDHEQDAPSSAQENRLYFFNTFTVTPTRVDPRVEDKDDRRVLNSMPFEMKDGVLIIDLPKANTDKCHQ